MHKIIAFEGLPASGKTTVINRFKEMMAGKPKPLIIDRFIYSTMIYDLIIDRDCLDKMKEFYEFISRWQDILVVYLDVNPDVSISRDMGRGKWKVYTKDDLLLIRNLYELFFGMFPLPLLRIDGTLDVDDIVKIIIRRIGE